MKSSEMVGFGEYYISTSLPPQGGGNQKLSSDFKVSMSEPKNVKNLSSTIHIQIPQMYAEGGGEIDLGTRHDKVKERMNNCVTSSGGYCHLAFPRSLGTCSQVPGTLGPRQVAHTPILTSLHTCPGREGLCRVAVSLIKMIWSLSPLGPGSSPAFCHLVLSWSIQKQN